MAATASRKAVGRCTWRAYVLACAAATSLACEDKLEVAPTASTQPAADPQLATPTPVRGFEDVPAPPSSAADRPLSERLYKTSHAVVFGIDAYQKLDPLGGAVRDARAVAAALTEHGFTVQLVLDRDATMLRVREVLGDELPARLEPEDRVVVYFAGHGVSVGEPGSELGYLMPIEGDRARPRSTGLSMSELAGWFERYRSKHVLFIADACYSGLALNTRNTGLSPASAAYLEEITSRPVRYSLVAGTADQLAHEADNQGVFTRFVLEGIAGAADQNGDGLVTTDELSSFVKPSVASFVQTRFGRAQLPQSARSGTGELVFLRPHARNAVAAAAQPATTEQPSAKTPAPAPAPASETSTASSSATHKARAPAKPVPRALPTTVAPAPSRSLSSIVATSAAEGRAQRPTPAWVRRAGTSDPPKAANAATD